MGAVREIRGTCTSTCTDISPTSLHNERGGGGQCNCGVNGQAMLIRTGGLSSKCPPAEVNTSSRHFALPPTLPGDLLRQKDLRQRLVRHVPFVCQGLKLLEQHFWHRRAPPPPPPASLPMAAVMRAFSRALSAAGCGVDTSSLGTCVELTAERASRC